MNRLVMGVLLVLGVGTVLTWWQWDFLRGYAETTSTDLTATLATHPHSDNIGLIRFTYDDLGSLNTDVLQTHATPWKLTRRVATKSNLRTNG